MNKLKQLWKALWQPSKRYSLGSLLLVGFVTGILYWGGFNWALESTNTLEFCTSCHEMRDNLMEVYQDSVHYSNASGVRAVCSDCHVPKDWIWKMKRKAEASWEIYHKIMGTIDTPEKFEAKRLELAKRVWKTMKETDSRECRNCHKMTAMALEHQSRRARVQHSSAVVGVEDGDTCIDCHKGIAHKPVHLDLEEEAVEGDGESAGEEDPYAF